MELVKTSFDLPEELHAKFKAMCANNKTKMNHIIRELMNKWLITQQNKEVDKSWKK